MRADRNGPAPLDQTLDVVEGVQELSEGIEHDGEFSR